MSRTHVAAGGLQILEHIAQQLEQLKRRMAAAEDEVRSMRLQQQQQNLKSAAATGAGAAAAAARRSQHASTSTTSSPGRKSGVGASTGSLAARLDAAVPSSPKAAAAPSSQWMPDAVTQQLKVRCPSMHVLIAFITAPKGETGRCFGAQDRRAHTCRMQRFPPFTWRNAYHCSWLHQQG